MLDGNTLASAGVVVELRSPEPNMRLGLTKFPSEIARWIDMSKRGDTESRQRSIVRMDPTGDQSLTLIGDVSHISAVDLRRKFKLYHKPVLADHLAKTFPRLRATQVTLLVDDFFNKDGAEDILSYTVWYPEGRVPPDLAEGESIESTVTPIKLLVGNRWLGHSIT